jgi:PRC-barrel domain protein
MMPSPSVLALLAAALIAAAHGAQARDIRVTPPIVVAEGGAHSDPQAAPAKAATDDDEENLSPEEKMRRRFPQPVRVGDLIGLPVLDWDDSTIGYVRHVVRTPEGKIQLIVNQGRLFGWGGRLVQVPIEAVAILARQIDLLDIPVEEFRAAPAWSAATTQPIPSDDMIRIAVWRR